MHILLLVLYVSDPGVYKGSITDPARHVFILIHMNNIGICYSRILVMRPATRTAI